MITKNAVDREHSGFQRLLWCNNIAYLDGVIDQSEAFKNK